MSTEIENILKKGSSTFHLVGEARLSDYTFSLGSTYDSGWKDNKMNLGVMCGEGNTVYADLSGGHFDGRADSVLYCHGLKEENGQKRDDYTDRIEVDWADRFNEKILDTIGLDCFIRVGIERDIAGKLVTKAFLSAYDAVEYLQEHLEDGMIVSVRGQLSFSGVENTFVRKEIKTIYAAKAEEKDYKAAFKQTILLGYDSVGKLDKERGTIPISAWCVDYAGNIKVEGEKVAIKQNVAFPKGFELAINHEKPELTQRLIKKFFKVPKKDGITVLAVEGSFYEGASTASVSWDDVPADIKELVEMGLLTEDEARAKSAVTTGSRERRMVITRPAITYVGEGDERRATVSIDTARYTVADLMFLPALLALQETGPAHSNEADLDIDPTGAPFDDDLEALLGEM